MSGALLLVMSGGNALSATASPTTVTGYSSSRTTATVTSDSTTVNATGGTAPYSYAWTVIATTSGVAEVISPSSATTAFRDSIFIPPDTEGATFRCTVTDAAGSTTTVDVTASFTRV